MRDLKNYQQVHTMAVRDVKEILEESPLQWKQTNARIMDIGCGDGSMTKDVWRSYIPKSYGKIIGSDISQLCINFAKKYYESDRIQFMQLDIEKEIPKELEASFDHVISSYTFHWLNMQESAFTNVFNLLADGGSCLLIFLGYFKPYEMYHKLSRTPKWSEDLKHVKTKFMSPYHESKDPQSEITELMRRIGFRDIDVKLHHKTFDYIRGVDDFNMLMQCLNPFEGLKSKWDDFMEDYVKLDPNAGTSVYQLLVVRGVK